MSDNAADDEPTMEEILASIRRIISDESEDGAPDAGADETPAVAAPEPKVEEPIAEEPEPAPEPTPEPAPEPAVAESEEPVVEETPEADPAPEPMPEEPEEEDVLDLTDLAPEPAPMPQPAPQAMQPEPSYSEPRNGPVNPIVSPPVETKASESFANLSYMMVADYNGSDNTLESVVRAMLKPMLQEWLDQNLPGIVQDAVEREVARISRRR